MSDAMELPKASLMTRHGLSSMDCIFCGEEVHLSQINWEVLESFRELVHLGNCSLRRSAHRDKAEYRGC